nr:MAG TPA: hypothetical protein [Caudoviricetes sp.]
MEKLYLTHGKTLSIYHHRNNCGENVTEKILDNMAARFGIL